MNSDEECEPNKPPEMTTCLIIKQSQSHDLINKQQHTTAACKSTLCMLASHVRRAWMSDEGRQNDKCGVHNRCTSTSVTSFKEQVQSSEMVCNDERDNLVTHIAALRKSFGSLKNRLHNQPRYAKSFYHYCHYTKNTIM